MCVIAIKPVGIPMIKEVLFKKMWDTNEDGAGFMYMLHGKVHISKGYMDFVSFTNAIASLEKRLMSKNVDISNIPFVFHFRIATHGGVSKANTHPFPVVSNDKLLKETELITDLGVCHNGIISSVTSSATMSDTMVYVTDVMANLYSLNNSFHTTLYGKQLMENTIGASKLAFLDSNGNIETVGEFKQSTNVDYKGLLFSNLNHEMTYNYGGYKGGSSWNNYYNYYGSSTRTVKTIYAKPLPIGSILTSYENLDKTKGELINKTRSVSITKTNYEQWFVDDFDVIYIMTAQGMLIESSVYDYVLVDVDGVLYELTTDDIIEDYSFCEVIVYSKVKEAGHLRDDDCDDCRTYSAR